MTVTALPPTGNSSKFFVALARQSGEFTIALSYTLRSIIWKLETPEAELAAASELAEAIVSRHDTKFPYRKTYVFSDHNTQPTVEAMAKYLRKNPF